MTDAQTQPTPSPLCNYLIETVGLVRDGRLEVEKLAETVRENHRLFAEAREKTMANLRAQGEDHMRRFAEQIGAMQDAFVEMEAAFKVLARYVESRYEADYQESVERLTRAGIMSIASTDAYQRAEFEQGPTKMPLLNLLHGLKKNFLAGSATREDFVAGIQGAARMARTAAQEVRDSEKRVEGEEGLIRAYERFADVVERLEGAIDRGEIALDAVLDEAEAQAEQVRSAMEDYNARLVTEGPTEHAHVNFILNLSRAHADGKVATPVLARGLEVFAKASEDLETEIESLASIPSSSSSIGEEMERVRGAFALNREAMGLFQSYLQEADLGVLEQAQARLVDATERLMSCKVAFERISETEGKVPCMRCGAQNEPSNRSCSRCGAQLIVPAGLEAGASTMSFQEEGGEATLGGGFVMTENLYRLFDSVNRVAIGRMSAEEFEGILAWMEGLVQQNLLGVPPAPEFPREGLSAEQQGQVARLEDELARARDDIETGAQEFLAALERMRRFTEDSSKDHLMAGVREARDAAAKIQQANAAIEQIAEEVARGQEEQAPATGGEPA